VHEKGAHSRKAHVLDPKSRKVHVLDPKSRKVHLLGPKSRIWEGCKKEEKLKTFRPVFGGFSPEADPKTLNIAPSARNGAECTQNQPRRPILRPFREVFGLGAGGNAKTRFKSVKNAGGGINND